jgi:hypothetical protein
VPDSAREQPARHRRHAARVGDDRAAGVGRDGQGAPLRGQASEAEARRRRRPRQRAAPRDPRPCGGEAPPHPRGPRGPRAGLGMAPVRSTGGQSAAVSFVAGAPAGAVQSVPASPRVSERRELRVGDRLDRAAAGLAGPPRRGRPPARVSFATEPGRGVADPGVPVLRIVYADPRAPNPTPCARCSTSSCRSPPGCCWARPTSAPGPAAGARSRSSPCARPPARVPRPRRLGQPRHELAGMAACRSTLYPAAPGDLHLEGAQLAHQRLPPSGLARRVPSRRGERVHRDRRAGAPGRRAGVGARRRSARHAPGACGAPARITERRALAAADSLTGPGPRESFRRTSSRPSRDVSNRAVVGARE